MRSTLSREEMMRWLQSRGFSSRVNGGHAIFKLDALCVVVPSHGRRDMKTGTLAKIRRDLRRAGVEVDF